MNGFIIGTSTYKKKIEKAFFNELINENLCKIDIIEDNINSGEFFVYSCDNNGVMNKNIESFPNLYFEIKINDLIFNFTYKDLFKVFNDRLYFLIIFKNVEFATSGHIWTFGDTFFRKYTTFLNSDSKTILLFRNQINNVNKKYYDKKEKNTNNKNNVLRVLFEIFLGIIILVVLFLLYKKYRSTRKLHANELEDSNYEYKPKEDKNNSELLINNDD